MVAVHELAGALVREGRHIVPVGLDRAGVVVVAVVRDVLLVFVVKAVQHARLRLCGSKNAINYDTKKYKTVQNNTITIISILAFTPEIQNQATYFFNLSKYTWFIQLR